VKDSSKIPPMMTLNISNSKFRTTVCWYDDLARSWPLGLSGGVSVALRLKKFVDPRARLLDILRVAVNAEVTGSTSD
jgi:hypothetical protein